MRKRTLFGAWQRKAGNWAITRQYAKDRQLLTGESVFCGLQASGHTKSPLPETPLPLLAGSVKEILTVEEYNGAFLPAGFPMTQFGENGLE